ncbi:Protein IMPACT [Blattella germanica]|nr:Protein IMPACT [Blattella germanica]
MTDNLTRQVDEIEALCSIYGTEWRTDYEENRSYSIQIEDAILYVTLPPDYPLTSPPHYQLSAPYLGMREKQLISSQLDEVYLHVLEQLKENRKIANATHNISAYRIYKEDTKCFLQDCDDDGETQAGGRLLHLLQILGVQNVMVVVSRWYGGVHLGPDRFRHINNAARQVLEIAGLVSTSNQQKKSKKKDT